MAMWAEYLMLASPAAFPWFYLVCWNLPYTLNASHISKPSKNTWCRSRWHCWCCWDTRRTARSTTTSSWSTSATSCRSRWSHRPSSSLQHPPLGRPGSRPILHSGLFVWLALPMQIQGDWPPLQYRNVKKDNDPTRAPVPFHLRGPLVGSCWPFFISVLFQQSTNNPHHPQSWSDRDRHPRVAELDGVPQSGQDDQLLHPHHASAHLLYAGAGAVLFQLLNNQIKLC